VIIFGPGKPIKKGRANVNAAILLENKQRRRRDRGSSTLIGGKCERLYQVKEERGPDVQCINIGYTRKGRHVGRRHVRKMSRRNG